MNQSSTPGEINGVIVLADPENLSPYISSDKKLVVLFEMTGCPFCLMFQQRFLDFFGTHSQDCDFLQVKLDAYDNPLWKEYDIKAVPTVIVFSEGLLAARLDATPFLGISKKKWADFCASFK